MIRKATVIVCDICGSMEEAKIVDIQRNEEIYGCPDGWERSRVNEGVHFCPNCLKNPPLFLFNKKEENHDR